MKKTVDLHHVTQQVLSEVLGVSTKAIQAWRDCPRNRDSSYDLAVVVPWRVRQLEERAGKKESAKSSSTSDLETRKLEAEVKLKELQIREKEKDVWSRDWVRGIVDRQAVALREFWSHGWKRDSLAIMQRLGVPVTRTTEFLAAMEEQIVKMMSEWCANGKDIEE